MNLAHVDKLAEDINGVKYILVRQDLFDGTVDSKGMKTKDSKETVCVFLTLITKENRAKELWVEKGTKFAGEFEKLCKAEGILIYSTMSETRAALAEHKYDPWKMYFPVTLKNIVASTFTNGLNSLEPRFPEKVAQ